MFGYVKKSVITIGRAYMMYRPLAFFSAIAAVFGIAGGAIGIRFLFYFFHDQGGGHVQSLILASMLIIIAVLAGVIGLLADVISANRKLIEEVQYEVRKLNYGKGHEEMKLDENKEECDEDRTACRIDIVD